MINTKKKDDVMNIHYIFLFLCYLFGAPLKAINDNKNFVIVIPSFNNSLLYKENLDSVFFQNYENYRVIYIDDCSNDQTADLVENYISEKNQNYRCTLIKNKKRCGALENLWRAIHSCDPHDIIITLDGDDALAHNGVLEYLNNIYQNENIWLTYGQFCLKSNGAHGWCSKMPNHIVQNNSFRTFPHLPGHLRTFYAWLFHQIKLEDLITHRGFYSMTWDIAMMMPMIEMAGNRHQFIDEILYVYNDTNIINDDKINKQLQSYLSRILRSKKPYQKLKKSTMEKIKSNNVSLVIISQENPMQLFASLESIFLWVKNIDSIHVIYRTYDEITKQGYEYIKHVWPLIQFNQIDTTNNNIKEILEMTLKNISSDFTIFSTDKMIIKQNIDLKDCVRVMQKTHAYAFHFRLGKDICKIFPLGIEIEIPHLISVDPNFFAWNFQYADTDWAYASNLEFAMYETDQLRNTFKKFVFHDLESLEIQWANLTDINHIGLCCEVSCARKVSLKNEKNTLYTSSELSYFFSKGLKIDMQKINATLEKSSRLEVIADFIKK